MFSSSADSGKPLSDTSGALRFGVYPDGGVGSVNGVLAPRPELPEKRLTLIRKLQADSAFVVHLYQAYRGGGRKQASEDLWLDAEIERYTSAGILVELVARFRPEGQTAAAGYSDYVRALVRRYGGNPLFIGLQVTNEANVTGSVDASDGAYPSVMSALVNGVKAGSSEADASGAGQLKIGFNWAFESSGVERRSFWNELARVGGPGFPDAVDWVGLNSYPGTWTPRFKGPGKRLRSVGGTLLGHLTTLRRKLMPRAGLGRNVPIHISENGWPTGPCRSRARQARVLWSSVRAVQKNRKRLNISDYRWFSLRDGRTGDSNFESQYGLVDDRYRPKPVFGVFKRLIAGRFRAARSLLDAPGRKRPRCRR